MKKSLDVVNDVLKNETILRLKKTFALSSYANALVLIAVGLMSAGGNGFNALILSIVMMIINIILPSFIVQKLELNGDA